MGSFDDWRKPHMARGDFMFNGYAVVISNHLPREHVGHEVYSYAGHPFWQWLRRTFGIGYGISMERGRPIVHDQILMAQGKVFMSARSWQQLKAAVAAQP